MSSSYQNQAQSLQLQGLVSCHHQIYEKNKTTGFRTNVFISDAETVGLNQY